METGIKIILGAIERLILGATILVIGVVLTVVVVVAIFGGATPKEIKKLGERF